MISLRSLFSRTSFAQELQRDAHTLGVTRGEHIMATGKGPETYQPPAVIATDHALYFATATEPTRLPWISIARASWEDPWLVLHTVTGEKITLHLAPAGELPPVVRDRVTASVLIRERVALDSGGTVVCVGRREPGSDTVTWLLEFDADTDSSSPEIRASADRALTELRATLGV